MMQSLWLFGTHLSILADETQTSSLYDLIEGTFAPGVETPLHSHSKYSELIFVTKGEFTIYTNQETVILKPGKSFFIPQGTPHMVSASSEEPSTALTIASPSGFAKVIRLFGKVDPGKDVLDLKLVEEFNQKTIELGDEILGAPGTRPAIES
ncbi:cupin domain-containing protein [Lacibacter sediminis]|uniref:Cupin domain-containing protein n=1 Tax=Lacibacter sediminis TaxID=2760713 RepID=A0A7G5XK66_9BACT|nr:cupin domain-containing protein [Lacibacter sediminis]QNA45869.1 cupin domain-containing protein [Lacibacter sediminis]